MAEQNVHGNVMFIDLPDEIITVIFSYVPAKDLVKRCSLVSKMWNNIISEQTLWRLKCQKERKYIPSVMPVPDDFKKLYFFNPFARNFLKNPCAVDGLLHWTVTHNGGDRFLVENTPSGAMPLTTAVDISFYDRAKNWATSYALCEKKQTVDLIKEGCSEEILDKYQPPIQVSEWYAGRFDCGCVYYLSVKLLSASNRTLKKFKVEKQIDQWAGKEWEQTVHTFTDYGPGVRFVEFKHGGKDTQFWAGHYGPKFTLSSVQFHFT